jgi:S-formylglutathione hydrolase
MSGGVCQIDLKFNLRPGYDHSYYFVSSFMEEHLRGHDRRLRQSTSA